MDILIYALPEKTDHKMKSKLSSDPSAYCWWTASILPKLDNLNKIKFIYFSDGKKIYARGRFRRQWTLTSRKICFSPLEEVDLEQPRVPPTRGWCYINE